MGNLYQGEGRTEESHEEALKKVDEARRALREKEEARLNVPHDDVLARDLADLLSRERVSLREPTPLQPVTSNPLKMGPSGNVTREQFLSDVRGHIRDLEHDARAYEENPELQGDLFAEKRAHDLREQALRLRSFLPENR